MARNSVAGQVQANKGPREQLEKDPDLFVPTGSTLLNLCLSDTADGGYALGTMVNLIGDSSSGKTFLALSCFAEAARDPRFKNYRFIFDDVEAANAFDIDYLFGPKVAARLEAPKADTENPASDTVQEFNDNVFRAVEDGRPFIYILDSLDALTTEDEIDKSEEQRKARETGKEVKGSYGMSKAKGMSELFRQLIRAIKRSNGLLIVVSQTRDNVDPMSYSKKTRSGGKALKFYATHELWVAVGTTHKKRDRIIGVNGEVKVSKNKITGKRRECTLPIFYDYGIDDISACIDWLVEEGFWKKTKLTINATEDIGIDGTKEKLIRYIEENTLQEKLRGIVGDAWHEIERDLKLNRKPKYE